MSCLIETDDKKYISNAVELVKKHKLERLIL